VVATSAPFVGHADRPRPDEERLDQRRRIDRMRVVDRAQRRRVRRIDLELRRAIEAVLVVRVEVEAVHVDAEAHRRRRRREVGRRRFGADGTAEVAEQSDIAQRRVGLDERPVAAVDVEPVGLEERLHDRLERREAEVETGARSEARQVVGVALGDELLAQVVAVEDVVGGERVAAAPGDALLAEAEVEAAPERADVGFAQRRVEGGARAGTVDEIEGVGARGILLEEIEGDEARRDRLEAARVRVAQPQEHLLRSDDTIVRHGGAIGGRLGAGKVEADDGAGARPAAQLERVLRLRQRQRRRRRRW
jgi:hypothetical protein